TLAMIFEKPSLRTRVSFEAGMTQLGGHAIYLGPNDIQMGVRETPSDIARNLERMADIIMARVFEHQKLIDLSKDTKVPVINGLSDLEHPCQAMADILTVLEKKKKLKGLKVAFIGDGDNNVTRSLFYLCGKLGIDFICAAPLGYGLKMGKETTDPKEAIKNADVVIADTWVSMGDEKEKKTRLKIFPPYQINKKLMKLAKPDAIFMHCLPAYRGYEVTNEVIDGPQSVVFDEAENRLHVQKAIMLFLLDRLI
ncbi:MAG: Ornithine carbamoyltransferase, catabolic, partial [Candidatus Amesbacteria bacterium GW2011_GWC1_46_24]